MTKTLHKKRSVSSKRSTAVKRSNRVKRTQSKRSKKYSRKNTKRSTKRSSKKIRVLQSGGNFNDTELAELNKRLHELNLFSEEEIAELITKMGLSSQFFTGPYFAQLTEKLVNGNFRTKEEFMEWFNNLFPNLEENVETDVEYDDNDDEDN